MQTQLADFIKDRPEGQRADQILRSCVHCGFCTATCPTYQLLGDELDGPRGRIYLIKQLLEGQPVSKHSRDHLDRCLVCRSCETTCPSGVQYAQLLDIARPLVEQRSPARPWPERLKRRLTLSYIRHAHRLPALLKLGQALSPLLPSAIRTKIPAKQVPLASPPSYQPSRQPRVHTNPAPTRKIAVLNGCIQNSATPNTNTALAQILHHQGIQLEPIDSGCCGAADHHGNAHPQAIAAIRRNLNHWWQILRPDQANSPYQALVINASGCAVHVKDYPRLLAEQTDATAKELDRAQTLAALSKDPIEILEKLPLDGLKPAPKDPIAFHAPCTLQHGERLNGRVEALLKRLGHRLTPVQDAHLCCGSAGTYSLWQAPLAQALRDKKLQQLQAGQARRIATANIGCQLHLSAGTDTPVIHWLELIAAQLPKDKSASKA